MQEKTRENRVQSIFESNNRKWGYDLLISFMPNRGGFVYVCGNRREKGGNATTEKVHVKTKQLACRLMSQDEARCNIEPTKK